MMKKNDTDKLTAVTQPKQRQLWVKPVLQKIKAGDAEVGTRTSSDGAFTTS
jgi:hypothetical protein